MKILKILSALLLMIGATWAFADPPSQVGRLNYVYGTVSFAPAEANNDWTAATLNRPMTTGDRLWADRDGRAEMHIGSTAVRLAALTSVDVLSLDDRGTQLRLAQGAVNVRLRNLDANESFEIDTPGGAVVLTRPGSYRVSVDPSGATSSVLVRAGQADVLTGNAPFSVRDNQLAAVSGSGQEVVAAPPADEFDNWSAMRDQREDNVAATRYVGQEMTGYEDLDQYGSWRTADEYGAVWVPGSVPAGWAPYRDGHWVWISPWGWTWVDDAPWGFAPYHYGRWVWLGNHWAWAPGTRVARPVYAPALVAFVGGANWSVSVSSGPAVGWVPLGWREPYIPWYRTSPAYVRKVNVTHVTNVTVINQYTNVRNVNNVRYVNRGVPTGVTVVPRETFTSARPVQRAVVQVPAQTLTRAQITHQAPVTRPERASFVGTRPGPQLPATVAAREVVAVKAPPVPVRVEAPNGKARNDRVAGRDDHPRVRVLNAQQRAQAPVPPQTASPAAANGRTGQALNTQPPGQPGLQAQRREPERDPRANAPSARSQIEAQRQQQEPQQAQQQEQREKQARQQEQERSRVQQDQQRREQEQQRQAEQQQQARQQQERQRQTQLEQRQQEQQQAKLQAQQQQRLQAQREQQRQQQTQQRQVEQQQARSQAQQQREQQQARQQQDLQRQQMQQRQAQEQAARQQQMQQQRQEQRPPPAPRPQQRENDKKGPDKRD